MLLVVNRRGKNNMYNETLLLLENVWQVQGGAHLETTFRYPLRRKVAEQGQTA